MQWKAKVGRTLTLNCLRCLSYIAVLFCSFSPNPRWTWVYFLSHYLALDTNEKVSLSYSCKVFETWKLLNWWLRLANCKKEKEELLIFTPSTKFSPLYQAASSLYPRSTSRDSGGEKEEERLFFFAKQQTASFPPLIAGSHSLTLTPHITPSPLSESF